MPSDPVSQITELGWTVYQIVAPILGAAATWVAARIALWIRAKTRNELVAGILVRLNDSVIDAVRAVNQETSSILGRARDPTSPGGAKLTQSEATKLRRCAIEHVKSYWGVRGLAELVRVLGIAAEDVEKIIVGKLEATVGEEKRSRSPEPARS